MKFKKRCIEIRLSKFKMRIGRVDIQVSLLTALTVVISCLSVFYISYTVTYKDMIKSLENRAFSIYTYIENEMDKDTYCLINEKDDIETGLYKDAHILFERIKRVTGVQYLYTAKQTENGDFVYLIDGLDLSASDFRFPGDKIEPEITDALERALSGEIVWPEDIKRTDWGDIFITYMPIHSDKNPEHVIGVVGIEFQADSQYLTYLTLRTLAPFIILLACTISAVVALVMFRRISNPLFSDLANSDYLTKIKNRNAYEIDTQNTCALGKAFGTGIILMDLNGLKNVNDTLGHKTGDKYIQALANSLKQARQYGEVCYRVGGDEFIVLISNATVKVIDDYIARVHQHFEIYRSTLPPQSSFAVGYAICDSNAEDAFEKAYAIADKNMYSDKKAYYEAAVKL